MTTMKKWKKEEIQYKMKTDDRWLIKGLLAIYKRQTDDEQSSGATKHDNGVGFNGVDSSFLSNAAVFYMKAGFLTPKHMAAVRKAMHKYAGQLAQIANGML